MGGCRACAARIAACARRAQLWIDSWAGARAGPWKGRGTRLRGVPEVFRARSFGPPERRHHCAVAAADRAERADRRDDRNPGGGFARPGFRLNILRIINHWIDGKLDQGGSERRAPVWNPATGEQQAWVA